jgi:hypothetical protein
MSCQRVFEFGDELLEVRVLAEAFVGLLAATFLAFYIRLVKGGTMRAKA